MSRASKVAAAEKIAKLARKPKAAKGTGKRKEPRSISGLAKLGLKMDEFPPEKSTIADVTFTVEKAITALIACGPGSAENVTVNGAVVIDSMQFTTLFVVKSSGIVVKRKIVSHLTPGDKVTIGFLTCRRLLHSGVTWTEAEEV